MLLRTRRTPSGFIEPCLPSPASERLFFLSGNRPEDKALATAGTDFGHNASRRVELVDYLVTEPEKIGLPLTLKRFGKHRCQQNQVGIPLVQLRHQPFIIEAHTTARREHPLHRA